MIRILAFLCTLVTLFAQSDRWPQYRGPGGAGIADAAVPVEFGPRQNALWSVETPRGHSSPSIWGNHLFLTSFDENSKKLEVLAYDRRTGKLRWRQTIEATGIEKVHAVSSPATATPIVDGERVYVYFGSAGLFCYDLDGKLVWSKAMPTADVNFGSGTSPVLAGDSLILACDHGEHRMIALARKTGEVSWDVKLGGFAQVAGHATPVVWKDQVILHRAGEIAGYDSRNGSRLWWVFAASQGTGTPVVHGDVLYAGAWAGTDVDLRDPIPEWSALVQKYDKDGNGMLSKDEFPGDLAAIRRLDAGATPGAVMTFKRFFDQIDPNHDGQISREEWETIIRMFQAAPTVPTGLIAIRLGGEKNLTKTNVLWSEGRGVPEVPVPLVYRDRVYAVTNGGIVTVLDQASGKLVYRGRLGAGGLYYASPVAAGDYIYFGSGEGVVSVIRAGDKLDVVARNDLGEPVFATPAIAQGRLYVRTAGHLYEFGRHAAD